MPNEMRKKIEKYSYGLNDHLDLNVQSNIFKGVNEETQDRVVISVVDLRNRQPDFTKQILNFETEALKKLKHPNIIHCYDIYSTVNNCYIITEFCDEGDLKNKISNRGHFKEAEAITIFRDIIHGFLYLAEQKYIHGNLKPSCILAKDGVFKISGFSNCRKVGKEFKNLTKFNPFQSPESMREAVFNHRSDIWSLGMILYLLLHGTFPWDFTNKPELLERYTKPFSTAKQLSEDIREFLKRTLTARESRLSLEQLVVHPFILRIRNSNYFTPEKYGLAVIGNLPEVNEPKAKKDSLQTSLNRVEKQLACQFNWLRYLFRLIEKINSCNYPEDSSVLLLKFIIIRQMAAQYESLKRSLNHNESDFGFQNWREFLEQKERANKFRDLLKQNQGRYQKIKSGYKRLMDKLNIINSGNNKESWSNILNENFVLSEYNSMVAIRAAVDEIRKIWGRITKEYPCKEKYEPETPFRFRSELVLLDLFVTYYQLNSFLVDDFRGLEYFEKKSKLEVIIDCQPAELDLSHLKEVESRLTQLLLIP